MEEKVYYSHGKYVKNKFTIAVKEVIVPENTSKTYAVGISICNKKDMFNKQIGRELSLKRANENPLLIITLNESINKPIKTILRMVYRLCEFDIDDVIKYV